MKRVRALLTSLVTAISLPLAAVTLKSESTPTFTPAWQPLKQGAGGAVTGAYIYPDGTMVNRTDTYGGYVWNGETSTWSQLVTSTSMPSSALTVNTGIGGNAGIAEIAAAPSNTNLMAMIWNGLVYTSTNRGATWIKTSQVSAFQANNTKGAKYNPKYFGPFLAFDPANADTLYAATPGSGVFVSANGGSTWSQITAVGVGATYYGHLFAFDPTSGVVGGVTRHFWINTYSVGVYETTNGGSSYALTTGTPATITHMASDKFGQLWAVSSIENAIYRYSSGSWSTVISGLSNNPASISADPNSSSQKINHVAIVTAKGDALVTNDNGSTWTQDWNNNLYAAGANDIAWLGNANQYSACSGTCPPNFGDFANVYFDGRSNLWGSAGIGMWEASAPVTGDSGSGASQGVKWYGYSKGIEQLVTVKVISPPGNSPLTAVYDRGIFLESNPDVYPSNSWNDSSTGINLQAGTGVDWASSSPNFVVGYSNGELTPSQQSGSSSDGGNTWSLWSSTPPGATLGGCVAAASATNWVVIPGQNQVPYYTTNGGSSWSVSSISGNPTGSSYIANWLNNRQPCAADRVNIGTFYLSTQNHNVYVSTNDGATFSLAARACCDGTAYADQLKSVPGKAGNLFFTAGQQFTTHPNNTHLWRSINSGSRWSICNSNLREPWTFGFGAAQPGGGGYPAVYAYGWYGGKLGVWRSTDECASFQQVSSTSWPLNSLDEVQDISGDANVYGRVYITWRGSGAGYYDTSDAVPWVNFNYSVVKPNATLTGTVNLDSQESGLVPVASVTYEVDGTTIGKASAIGGRPTTYRYSWVTGGVSHGPHTLCVTAVGYNPGKGQFCIPIATS